MRATTAKPLLTTAATLGVAALILTGCAGNGGSTSSGTYYGETGKGSDPAIIVIDGGTLTWGEFGCDDIGKIDKDDSDTSVGTLDKTHTTVAWTQEGRYSNIDPFTESEDGSVITMSDGTYSKVGTDTGDAILSEREDECGEQDEKEKEREAAQTEQAEADTKIKPAFDKALAALFKAAESGNLSDTEGIFAQNDITADEFVAYLERNYNGLPAYELFDMLQADPSAARELLEEYGQ